jgi:hypothetical protein
MTREVRRVRDKARADTEHQLKADLMKGTKERDSLGEQCKD